MPPEVTVVETSEPVTEPVTVIVEDGNDGEAVAPEVVETIHDDALNLGYALGEISNLNHRVSVLEGEVAVLAASSNAALDAVTDVVESLESLEESIEDSVDDTPEEQPADTPPGKTHWLKRPAGEWMGRH